MKGVFPSEGGWVLILFGEQPVCLEMCVVAQVDDEQLSMSQSVPYYGRNMRCTRRVLVVGTVDDGRRVIGWC